MSSTPHDELFRKTLGIPEHAAGELRAVLPRKLAKRIDWSTLRAEPGSFVDSGGPQRHTDLLFSATIDGRAARIYVLFEHQSSFDRWMPLRLLVYMGRIWVSLADAGAASLPIIIPVVLHNGEGRWTGTKRFSGLLHPDGRLEAARAFVPDFQFVVDDLAAVSEDALLRRPMSALARVTVWVMRAARHGFEPALLGAWIQLLRRAHEQAEVEAYWQLFVYLSEVEGGESLFKAIEANVGDEEREQLMGLRRQWVEEGREEGREEGLELGIKRGRVDTLLSLLQLKFGDIGEARREQIASASLEELERWSRRILSATSLEDVLG
jgi:predicted transposase/invertase (TIGR01784 family)